MANSDIWRYIGSERSDLADAWETLTPEQWSAIRGVKDGASKTLRGTLSPRPNRLPQNSSKSSRGQASSSTYSRSEAQSAAPPREHASLFGAFAREPRREITHPGPSSAMLGEVIVHGEDIRRPLGLTHRSPEPAVLIVADAWKKSDLLIGSKTRMQGLRLTATDAAWTHGEGPEVSGPLQSLILAMTGRKQVLVDLSGDGISILAMRH